MRLRSSQTPRKGAVLLAVLVVIVLLSLAAYQFSESMLAEYKAADSYRRSAQARAAANSGLHYAAALLASADSITNNLNGNPYSNTSMFQAIVVADASHPRFRGMFSVVAPVDDEDQGGVSQAFRYGVIDEAGKLNINALFRLDSSGSILEDRLMGLPNMTEDIANAIIDWLDEDEEPRSNGAENEYYMTLNQPYRCKNGPLDSIEELLLVKGVTPQLLFGNDRNRNGVLDPDEDDGSGVLDRGWAAYLTVHSREQNVDSTGQPRIWINDNDLNGLQSKLSSAGIDEQMIQFILAYRRYGPYTQNQSGQGGTQGGGTQGTGGGGGGTPASTSPISSSPTNSSPTTNSSSRNQGRGGQGSGGQGSGGQSTGGQSGGGQSGGGQSGGGARSGGSQGGGGGGGGGQGGGGGGGGGGNRDRAVCDT